MVSCAPTWFRAGRIASNGRVRSASSIAASYPGIPAPTIVSMARCRATGLAGSPDRSMVEAAARMPAGSAACICAAVG